MVDSSHNNNGDFVKDITELSKSELLNPGFIPSIFTNYQDKNERKNIITELLAIARREKCVGVFKKKLESYESERKLAEKNDILAILTINANNQIEPTLDNYYNVMTNDEEIYSKIRYNEMSEKLEYWGDNGVKHDWSDADDAELLRYIESKYNFFNERKYYYALALVKKETIYNPLKEIIEKGEWDGVPRIDKFLTKILKCDDNDYAREVSRMIFYGGISRLYKPGCKFDYMPIFMSPQGTGKSSIINWLALENDYYKEIVTIDGKEGIECLQGGWICEFAELLAMIRAREVESLKGYLTRLSDSYRPAYGRNVVTINRKCIFIGTTNDYQFLADKTGNRRYLPIEIHLNRGELFKHEKYIKNYILMCWREALHLFKENKIYLVIPSEYNEVIEQNQNAVTEEDPRVGEIGDFLETKEIGDKVCALEIYVNCFHELKKNFDKKAGREIGIIMRKFPEWCRADNVTRFQEYGTQRFWVKSDGQPTKNGEIIIDPIDDL